MVNSELFRQIADQIEANPWSHNQLFISCKTECGTAYCIGGWAQFLECGECSPYLLDDAYRSVGEEDTPSAQGLLGIDDKAAEMLFCSSWKPRPGLTVPEALRLIADGKSISEVSA